MPFSVGELETYDTVDSNDFAENDANSEQLKSAYVQRGRKDRIGYPPDEILSADTRSPDTSSED